MSKNNKGPAKANQEKKREEGHEKWALEIQTEGLDPEQVSPLEEAPSADKKFDERSKGSNCGCKYF